MPKAAGSTGIFLGSEHDFRNSRKLRQNGYNLPFSCLSLLRIAPGGI